MCTVSSIPSLEKILTKLEKSTEWMVSGQCHRFPPQNPALVWMPNQSKTSVRMQPYEIDVSVNFECETSFIKMFVT